MTTVTLILLGLSTLANFYSLWAQRKRIEALEAQLEVVGEELRGRVR